MNSTEAYFLDMGRQDYRGTRRLQHRLVAARKSRKMRNDLYLFVEHPAVITTGHNRGMENLLVSDSFLRQKNTSLVRSERGGDITYHGYGQLVVYPVVDLRSAGLRIKQYVHTLEQVMIEVAGEVKVSAARVAGAPGVWVGGERKLGSVGLAVRHGIAFHGFALNVNISLTPFGWIRPCGLNSGGMTSLNREVGGPVCMDFIRTMARKHVEKTMMVSGVPVTLEALENEVERHAYR